MPDRPARHFRLSDPELVSLLADVLSAGKLARSLTRVRARSVMQINGTLVLLYTLDWILAILRTEGAELLRVGPLIPFFLITLATGGYLMSRPLPRYPLRAALGSTLLAAGGVWLGLALLTPFLTWVLLVDFFPEPVASFLLDVGGHTPTAGLVIVGVGVWATATATWRRRQRRELVLYDPSDDDFAVAASVQQHPDEPAVDITAATTESPLYRDR